MAKREGLAMTHGLGSRFRYFVSDEVDDISSYVDGTCGGLVNQQNGGVLGDSLNGAHGLAVA